MSKPFAHLHCHTVFSLLDGISRREDLIKKTKEFGMNALAVTEHGNIFNSISFYSNCRKEGIKAVIGMESYIAPDSRFGRDYAKKDEAAEDAKLGDLSMSAYHLTLLAKNHTGYDNLKTLSTLAYREGFYRKPRIDDEILAAHKEGLIVLSGCLAGKVARLIVAGNREKALEEIDKMRAIFGDDSFYLEMMNHGISEEAIVNEALIDFANRTGIGLVMTGDSHFTEHGDEFAHEIALAIGTGKTINDANRFQFNGEGYHFKSPEEMKEAALAANIPQSALDNAANIAESIEDYAFVLNKPIIPLFKDNDGEVVPSDGCDLYLDIKAYDGLNRRGLANNNVYINRLKVELALIKKKNFSSYFLIIADIVDFMRNNNMPMGVGRGSAGGSLLCYCLYITGIDPIELNLSFSRFMNEGRNDLPDIDTDISQERRKEVIDYIVKKYGADRVAQIVTFQSMASKAAIDNVGRALGVPSSTRRSVGHLIGETDKDDKVGELVEANPKVAAMINQTPNWLTVSERLEGNNRNLGAHAAGITITNEPIINYVPLIKDSKEGYLITQYDMKDLEKLGLLKLDMLGVKTLDVIQKTIILIKERHGVEIDTQKISRDDRKTYAMLAEGKFVSVFQYDSSGFRSMLRALAPDCFEHLIAANSLYRPGPMLSGSGTNGKSILDNYIARRHGREDIEVWHNDLREAFKDTFGLCIAAEEYVTLYNGSRKQIKDIKPGDILLSFGSSPNRVTHKITNGIKDVIKIVTADGRSVRTTKDHLLLVNGGEKRAGNIKPGDFLHVPYPKLPTENYGLFPSQVYCIGLLLGDGSFGSTPSIALGNDPIWRTQCMSIFKDAFKNLDPVEYHHTRSYYLSLRMRCDKNKQVPNIINKMLMDYGLRKCVTYSKFIPVKILNSPDDIKLAMLAGLWDSDGTVTSSFQYTSISKHLRDGVASILNHFNIAHYTRGVRVYIRDTAKFMRLVPLRHHMKLIANTRSSKLLNFHISHLTDAFQESKLSQRAFCVKYDLSRKNLIEILNGKHKTISLHLIKKLGLDRLYQLYYDKHQCDEVISVTAAGNSEVYDLTMENSNTPWFTAGGVLVHNCLFQEQLMSTAQIIAGFTESEADELRHAIGKKNKIEFDEVMKKFKLGATNRGHGEKDIVDLIAKMQGSARYNWNRSHAASYSHLSYVTAYLEANYPLEYYTTLLNVNLGDNDELKKLLSAIIQKGIELCPPHINHSGEYFHTDGISIFMGLYSVKQVGDSALPPIIEDRNARGPYYGYIDFCIRMSPHGRVTKLTKENLVKAGAFSWDTTLTSKEKVENTELIQKIVRKFEGKLPPDGIYAEIIKTITLTHTDYTLEEKLTLERSVLNFYISSHPVVQYQQLFGLFSNVNLIVPSQIEEQMVGSKVTVLGVAETRTMKQTKNDDPYLQLKIGDQMGSQMINVWNPLCNKVYQQTADDQLVLLSGVIKEDKFRPGQNQLNVTSSVPIHSMGGFPITSFYCDDIAVANRICLALNTTPVSISDKILNVGHAVILRGCAHIQPKHFQELSQYKAYYNLAL